MLLTRRTVLAAAIETTAYTAEPFIASDSNFNVMDPKATPSIEMIDREAADGFSNRESIPGMKSGVVTFRQDLHPLAAGGAPPWADRFFPACGWVKTGNTFRPVSAPPTEGAAPDRGVRTLTLGVFEDGRLKTIRGAMGTFNIVMETGKNVYIDFTFTGGWAGVTDAIVPVPSYPTDLPYRFAATSFDLGGQSPCVQKLEWGTNNEVVLRPCQTATDGSGYRGGLVADRSVGGSVDPEAELVATDDVFGDWENSNPRNMVVTLDNADGNSCTITTPRTQFTSIGEAERVGIRVDPITWQANRVAAADDEATIEFSGP